jgi:phospholipase/lecithinase/hemolysin
VWVEYLAMAMSVDLPTPSNLGGTNYAWGGAETGDGLSARNTFNIGEQINGEEINSFLKYNRPKDNQLFIIWAGANDFNNVDEETPLPKPQDIVDNIIEHIRTLALASPDEKLRFMIPNLPLMGQTPGAQCLGLYVDPDIPLIFDGLSIDFNITLDRELKKLKKELKKDHSIKIILHKLDVFSLFQKMIINPAAFGFTNVSDTVRIREEGDLGCPLEVTDTGGKFVNDKYPDEDPDGYLFFDAIHPTTAAHKIIAEMALELINGQSIETECAD